MKLMNPDDYYGDMILAKRSVNSFSFKSLVNYESLNIAIMTRWRNGNEE